MIAKVGSINEVNQQYVIPSQLINTAYAYHNIFLHLFCTNKNNSS